MSKERRELLVYMKSSNKFSNLKNFSCISCNSVFSAYSSLQSNGANVKVSSCSNCNTFYNNSSSSEVRVGKVESFYKKEERANKKNR